MDVSEKKLMASQSETLTIVNQSQTPMGRAFTSRLLGVSLVGCSSYTGLTQSCLRRGTGRDRNPRRWGEEGGYKIPNAVLSGCPSGKALGW